MSWPSDDGRHWPPGPTSSCTRRERVKCGPGIVGIFFLFYSNLERCHRGKNVCQPKKQKKKKKSEKDIKKNCRWCNITIFGRCSCKMTVKKKSTGLFFFSLRECLLLVGAENKWSAILATGRNLISVAPFTTRILNEITKIKWNK